ncbi:MAG: SUF system NifU family Fe-S cluster assembly protein [Zetaproteobacteria bacterium]|nr:MAG: SUF system NifU family Fe-S cluster assembly protein [Zetaproteobacteria bacterium]
MFDLQSLYQQVIVDHNKSPRNFGELHPCSHDAEGYNPLCGDRIHLYLDIDDRGIIEQARFKGEGCAISTASASLMTEAIVGCSIEEFASLFDAFHRMATAPMEEAPDAQRLGKLAALAGVRAFPSRIKCATLCWHTARAAIDGRSSARTE